MREGKQPPPDEDWDEDDKDGDTSCQNPNSFPQIFAAVAVCFLCLCGGTLQGYTSAAIPSMRESHVVPWRPHPSLDIISNNIFLGLNESSPKLMGQVMLSPEDTRGSKHSWSFQFDPEEFRGLLDYQASWISGLLPLGAFVGSSFALVPLQCLGPKGAILTLAGPLFLGSWLLTAFAPFLSFVLWARFLGGLAIGIATSCAPVYIMDTSPVHLRGPLGTLPQVFFVVGILMCFVLGSFLEWRETAFTCATLTIPGLFLLVLTPESPKWLLRQRKYDQAQHAYFRLNGHSDISITHFLELKSDSIRRNEEKDLNANPPENKRLALAQEDIQKLGDGGETGPIMSKINAVDPPIPKSNLTFLINYYREEPGALKATLVVMGLMAFQQITGINGVNYYTVTIFNEALGSSDTLILNGHTCSIIVASGLVGATFSSIYLIEKLGRKLLLLLSVTFIGLGAFAIGSFFYMKDVLELAPEVLDRVAWLPLASLAIFVIAFSVGYGPVCWIIGAEILDSRIRPLVNPVAVGFNWFCVFAVAKTYPDLVNLLGTFGTFWLYGSLAIVGLVFTACCVPETKGKDEEEIRKCFI